jgi:hypothetical protein
LFDNQLVKTFSNSNTFLFLYRASPRIASDLKIFDLRKLSHTRDQGVISLTIDGKFNSTVIGNYDILVAEAAGQEYSTDFEIYELSHLWMDRYKHFFNPAPTIASPFILIGITLLIKGVASAIPQDHARASPKFSNIN